MNNAVDVRGEGKRKEVTAMHEQWKKPLQGHKTQKAMAAQKLQHNT